LGKHAGIGERLRQGGALVAKYAIPLVMQLLTAGVVRSDDVAEAVADVTTDMISKRIDDYKDAKQSVVQFKSTLAELTQSLGEEEEGRHVIFFVDELDRCRPTYAVEVLEIIKHLFDVGGVVFILAVTPEQLQHSVKALYGEGTDAIRYLQRFIDLEYRLPQPELNRYVDLLMNRLGLKSPKLQLPIDSVRAGIIAIAPVFGLSLRQLEKIVFQLALAARCKHQLSDASCWFLFFLLAMQWVKQDLYSSFVEKEDMNAVIRLAKEIQNTPNYRVQEHVDAAVHIYYMSETEINDRLGEFARKHKEYQYLSEFSFNVVRRAPAVLALLEGFNLED